jgi:hypothetical protein
MQIPFGHARVLLVIASLGFAACGMPDHVPDEDTDEIAAEIGDPNDPVPIDPPPTDLDAEQVTPDFVEVSFTCGGHATNHKVLRSTDGGVNVQVATLAACGSFFIVDDSKVEPARNNCYKVVASNSKYSATTSTLCVTTPQDFRVPEVPTGPVVSNIGTDRADLAFTDSSNNEGGFRVFLSEANAAWTQVGSFVRGTRSHHPTGERLSLTTTNLKVDTSYRYKIEVYHDFAPVSAERILAPFDTLPLPPTAPSNLHVTGVTTDSVSIAWSPGTRVEHYDVVQTEGIGNGTDHIGSDATSFTKGSRFPNVHYCYKVVSVNRAGSAETSPVCTTTAGAGSQMFDVLLALNPSDLYQGVFGPITGGILNSLELRVAANSGALAGFDFIPQGSTSSALCNDTSARVHVNIGGSVSGTDLAKLFGSSTPSLNGPLLIHGCTVPRAAQNLIVTAHFSSPPAAAPPTQPSGVTVASASSDGSITVTWDDTVGEDAYVIEQVGGGQDVPATWAAQDATSATISALQPLTTYCFQVTARNSAGSVSSPTLACATSSDHTLE